MSATVSSASVDVNNSLPEASSASLNGGSAIVLNENTTKSVSVTGTVTDNNSCKDLSQVHVAVYKSGATCTELGHANNDTCYFWTDSNPSNDASCTGFSDTIYDVSHSFDVQYYADPGTWVTTITPVDTTAAGTSDTSSNVTLNELQALAVSSTLSYGSVNNGQSSTGDHTITTSNTGNVAIDFDVSGTDLTCAALGTIPVGNQEYSLSSFSHGAGTALTTSATEVNADLTAPSAGTVPVTDPSYWQIAIPNGVKGVCSGTITFAVKGAI